MPENNTMMLTGSNGMVGKNILENEQITEWKLLAPSSKELDLTNYEDVINYLHEFKPNIIIHAAGIVGGIEANIQNPIEFLEKNTRMGMNLTMAAFNAGIKSFINLASTCMYPRNIEGPLKERMILTGELEPTNEGYALAKIVISKLCQYIDERNINLNYKTIIPCNLYGRHDYFETERSHLIPALIHKIHLAKIDNLNEVTMWGSGFARREFMFCADLADAILKAARSINSLPPLMNCGVGTDYSVREYYQIIAKIIGWEGNFVCDFSRPEGMHQKLSSIDLQKKWGWYPKTSLKEGIKLAYDYYLTEL
ncbi:GDP-L-fucose synthase [Alphaproteobacteria bacterium]|nr:GDP-L-fucose synthase [Alphaproteobacteria bacterium]